MAVKKMNLTPSGASGSISIMKGEPLSTLKSDNVVLTARVIQALRGLLEGREGVPILAHWQSNPFSETLTMESDDDETRLMIRIFQNRLIIKYAVLRNRRCGTLTVLVQNLCDRVRKYGIKQLEIESVLTDEMRQWCLKYGLKENPASGSSADGLGVSYIGELFPESGN